MSPRVWGGTIYPDEHHNYFFGAGVHSAFAAGELESDSDFWILALSPGKDPSGADISGNFLDSDGEVLFRLIHNEITYNPGNVGKIKGDQRGYQIIDSAGKEIFEIETEFWDMDRLAPFSIDPKLAPMLITTMKCQFYDKQRNLVFKATHQGGIEIETRFVTGIHNWGEQFAIRYEASDQYLTELRRVLAKYRQK